MGLFFAAFVASFCGYFLMRAGMEIFRVQQEEAWRQAQGA